MVRLIMGEKGTGKTKKLIEMTNAAAESEKGLVVFVDDDKRYMFDLKHEVRFVDAGEFAGICGNGTDVFLGFLSGMLSVNFDISLICIDAFKKLTGAQDISATELFFKRLAALSESTKCNFIVNISCEMTELPAYVAQFAI